MPLILAAAAALLLVLPASARADVVVSLGTINNGASALLVTSDTAAEANQLRIETDVPGEDVEFFDDAAGSAVVDDASTGTSCAPGAGDTNQFADAVRCSFDIANVSHIVIDLKNGTNTTTAVTDNSIGNSYALYYTGGTGCDRWTGSDARRRQILNLGGNSSSVCAQRATTGDYLDDLTAGSDADYLDGGGGNGDTVHYQTRTAALTITADAGGANDGESGEGDEIRNIEEFWLGAGNDTVTGDGSDEEILGNGGADHLFGNGGVDRLWGGPGQDELDGGPGNDILAGEGDNDVLRGGPGSESGASGGDGDDLIDLGDTDEPDTGFGGNGNDTIDGHGGNDTLNGGPGGDTLRGGTGNDKILGEQDADPLLDGGEGDDEVDGGPGDDAVIEGGPGNDKVAGGDGNDPVSGSDGDDVLTGGLGADVLTGAGGDDQLDGGPDADRADGGPGRDTVGGGDGDDPSVLGGLNDDVVTGGAGNDTVDGGLGDDMIDPGDGADGAFGGPGDDVLADSRGPDLIDGGDGTIDAIAYGVYDPTGPVFLSLDGAANDGRAGEGDNLLAMESLTGGPGADVITGDDGVNFLYGGDGADQIDGLGGIDLLRGQYGDDTVTGRDDRLTRDDLGCNEGLGDRAVADAGDVVASDCETVDRSPAPPGVDPGNVPPSGIPGPSDPGGGSGGVADRTAPGVTLRGVPRRLTRAEARKGVRVIAAVTEPARLQVRLIAKVRSARLSAAGDLVLAETTRPLAGGSRRIRLKAGRLLGTRARLRVEVVATDAAGNRTTRTATLQVAPKARR